MSTYYHCIIVYPFPGLEVSKRGYRLFLQLLAQCERFVSGSKPILIYDKRSRSPRDTKRIIQELSDRVEIVDIWGVDTCQDWLAGWGHVLDKKLPTPEEDHRLVLLPGDLEQVKEESLFFEKLEEFVQYDQKPFLVGDFDSVNPQGAKELIDRYGIYPLVANWFPEAWQAIQDLRLRKPRSEFVNIAASELRNLLRARVFAYEQTLNMLIVKWQECVRAAGGSNVGASSLWHRDVSSLHLGTIEDDSSARHYRGAIDQIERTERMLRMVWREQKNWNPDLNVDAFRKLTMEYELLDNRSTRIRDAARISIWALLNFRQSD